MNSGNLSANGGENLYRRTDYYHFIGVIIMASTYTKEFWNIRASYGCKPHDMPRLTN